MFKISRLFTYSPLPTVCNHKTTQETVATACKTYIAYTLVIAAISAIAGIKYLYHLF